jgi:eukaryotic-like serine/threonine-protein kinase
VNTDRWQQIKEIFDDAMQRPPAERAAFLDEACANDRDLRAEVEKLLASYETDFMAQPAVGMVADVIVAARQQLKAGQQLGRYRIIQPIGAGGMGEVYLAHDTELERDVALKILASDVAANQQRMQRFIQEAKAASALNHPNIITIHEVGQAEGLRFIATEYIKGENLRQRLRREQLSRRECFEVAVQVAAALSAAHEAKVVHRDIKPENIMLRPDGLVKVLDFGLAKLTEKTSPAPSIGSNVATRVQINTAPGMVMGTANYMSPEQARGKEVDARTDIWSFGIVLYEMLSGHMPFTGESSSDVIAAILKNEPAPLTSYVPDAPAELQRITKKTLRKERDERYQTARDLLIDLKDLRRELDLESESERFVAASAGLSDSAAASRESTRDASIDPTTEVTSRSQTSERKSAVFRRPLVTVIAGVAILGAAVALTLGIRALRRTGSGGAFQRTEITQLTTSRNLSQAAISPDGKYLAYAVRDNETESLWLRQANAANDLQIVAPAVVGYEGITFTRDTGSLYYVTRDRNGVSILSRIQVLGGTPQKLIANVDSPVTFSPDGKSMAFVRGKYPTEDQSALLIADSEGGQERILASRRAPQFFYPIGNWTGPSWSPDGELVACAIADVSNGRAGNVFTFRVKDGSEKRIMPKNFSEVGRVEWLADMNGLVLVGTEQFLGTFPGQVWYLSYPDGATRRITNDFGNYRSLSVTSDGSKLVTISFSGLYGIWTAPEGDASRARQIAPISRGGGLSWTPDGRIVYATSMSGRSDIWIMNADGSARKQLTSSAGQNFGPSVSPDGSHIAFFSTRTGRGDVWLIDIDGGNPRPLTKGLLTWQPSWSPDGKWVLFVTYPEWRIWKVPVGGGSPLPVTDRPAYRPVVSPDGKWLACFYSNSNDAASTETVYNLTVLPFEGGAPLKTFPLRGSRLDANYSLLQWTPDGRAVLYNTITNNVVNIWNQPIDGGEPKQATDFKDASITSFAWSRDGHWLACSRGTETSDAILITEIK